jgi:hypothetical protein
MLPASKCFCTTEAQRHGEKKKRPEITEETESTEKVGIPERFRALRPAEAPLEEKDLRGVAGDARGTEGKREFIAEAPRRGGKPEEMSS